MSTVSIPSRVRGERFRTDIQGLRAIAVLGVVVNHVWPTHLTGGYVGVDVFFVISGFLITSHLLSHPPTGVMDLGRFWARRARRLLPAALLTLAVVLLGSWLFAAQTSWENTARMVRAAALYFVNWLLANDSVDYFANNQPTPVQHFWSLSVEEQFYFVWPLLLLLVSWLSVWIVKKERGVVSRPLVVGVLGLIVVASLAASIWLTVTTPAQAYFVSWTRVWELGLGGLLAALGLQPPSRSIVRAALAWIGLAAIGAAFVLFTDATPFPGAAALLPVAGAALVIWANPQKGEGEPGTLLAIRPVQWVGDVSYSIYLWHWPILTLLPVVVSQLFHRGDPNAPGTVLKVVIVVVAIGVAAVSKYFVEDPLRRWRPQLKLRWVFAAAAFGMAIVVGVSSWQIVDIERRDAAATARVEQEVDSHARCFGAYALGDSSCPPSNFDALRISPAVTKNDAPWSGLYPETDCVAQPPNWGDGFKPCFFGDLKSSVTVALVGNSHSYQWLAPMEEIAKQRHWRLLVLAATGCVPGLSALRADPAEVAGCANWGRKVSRYLVETRPALVVTSNWQSGENPGGNNLADAKSQLSKWTSAGIPVVVIRDTPNFGFSTANGKGFYPPDCVDQHPKNLAVCDGALSPDYYAQATADVPNTALIDYTSLLCTDDRHCPAVIGDIIAYFDLDHMSRTFARTFEPRLQSSLASTGLEP